MAQRPHRELQEITPVITRVRLRITGIVQGVGFRPFVYRTAASWGLGGFVLNDPEGVVVEAEGTKDALEGFIESLTSRTPSLAEIVRIDRDEIPPLGEDSFRIESSETEGLPSVLIPPDIATCDSCLRELFDENDRRYHYPFINCTDCGPRLTIIRDVPYDRARTSMASFPLCEACRSEYENPLDRRFHAEPNACPVCGPRLMLLDERGNPLDSKDVLSEAHALIRQGAILAVKGLGGFHLCVDACNEDAVARLRRRKHREEKPLAVMVRDIETACAIVHLNDDERRLLLSPSRPIVICEAKTPTPVAQSVAPGMGTLGVMLPYTPFHHLLLARGCPVLVMTSANATDEPICIDNGEAVERLAGIADAFVVHDREILVRCDDSVAFVCAGHPSMIRRSRGYAPRPIPLREPLPPVMALGAHLKSAVCIVKDDKAFISPHVGDMETPLARDFFHETIELMQRIVRVTPDIVACDMHPGYYSTTVAPSLSTGTIVRVQHHHAHVASCMAEHRITGPVIGLAMDGTGYGEDGCVWGGEFLVADEAAFLRAAHLKYLPLPGGDAAVKKPWRFAISVLADAMGGSWFETASTLGVLPNDAPPEVIEAMLKSGVNSPLTSSLGRMFDAVAVLLGLKKTVSFEGQAAVMLEAAARTRRGDVLPYAIERLDGSWIIDLAPCIRAVVDMAVAGKDPASIAASFHATLIDCFTETTRRIRDRTRINRAVLSGGCFQNRILLEGCTKRLQEEGFEVYAPRMVPANDGGVCLGQAVVAAYRVKNAKDQ